MRKLIPILTLATTVALATVSAAEPPTCADLLGPMTGIMETMRRSATLSVAEQATWKEWTARCNTPLWQHALKTALPETMPPVPARLTHSNAAPSTGARSYTRRDYSTTTCSTFSTRYRAYTTCSTY